MAHEGKPWIIACHRSPNISATAPATSGPTPSQRNPMIAPNNSVVAGVGGRRCYGAAARAYASSTSTRKTAARVSMDGRCFVRSW